MSGSGIKSMFTRRDSQGGASTLPQPPTIREIIDDIERCDDHDPVRAFAQLLRDCELQAEPESNDPDNPPPFPPIRDTKDHGSHTNGTKDPLKIISAEQLANANSIYNRLKELLSMIETSETLIEHLEPKMKTLENESKSLLDALEQMKAKPIMQESFISAQDENESEEDSLLT